jgi:hypothetical protein
MQAAPASLREALRAGATSILNDVSISSRNENLRDAGIEPATSCV